MTAVKQTTVTAWDNPARVAFRLRPSGERKDWLTIDWYKQQG